MTKTLNILLCIAAAFFIGSIVYDYIKNNDNSGEIKKASSAIDANNEFESSSSVLENKMAPDAAASSLSKMTAFDHDMSTMESDEDDETSLNQVAKFVDECCRRRRLMPKKELKRIRISPITK